MHPCLFRSCPQVPIIYFLYTLGCLLGVLYYSYILTLDQLKRHGRAVANRCFLCEEDEETIEHLLIHCKKAKTLWDLFLSIVGTSWVFPCSVLHTLLAWQGASVGKKIKKIWRTLVHVLDFIV